MKNWYATMKTINLGKILLVAALAVGVSAPLSAAAAWNIWEGARCGGAMITTGGPTGSCDVCDGLIVGRNIVNILIQLSFVIATGMIVYGALQMILSTGNPGKVSQAKSVIMNALIGLGIALAAWLIVNTIITIFAPNYPMPWNQIRCE